MCPGTCSALTLALPWGKWLHEARGAGPRVRDSLAQLEASCHWHRRSRPVGLAGYGDSSPGLQPIDVLLLLLPALLS